VLPITTPQAPVVAPELVSQEIAPDNIKDETVANPPAAGALAADSVPDVLPQPVMAPVAIASGSDVAAPAPAAHEGGQQLARNQGHSGGVVPALPITTPQAPVVAPELVSEEIAPDNIKDESVANPPAVGALAADSVPDVLPQPVMAPELASEEIGPDNLKSATVANPPAVAALAADSGPNVLPNLVSAPVAIASVPEVSAPAPVGHGGQQLAQKPGHSEGAPEVPVSTPQEPMVAPELASAEIGPDNLKSATVANPPAVAALAEDSGPNVLPNLVSAPVAIASVPEVSAPASAAHDGGQQLARNQGHSGGVVPVLPITTPQVPVVAPELVSQEIAPDNIKDETVANLPAAGALAAESGPNVLPQPVMAPVAIASGSDVAAPAPAGPADHGKGSKNTLRAVVGVYGPVAAMLGVASWLVQRNR